MYSKPYIDTNGITIKSPWSSINDNNFSPFWIRSDNAFIKWTSTTNQSENNENTVPRIIPNLYCILSQDKFAELVILQKQNSFNKRGIVTLETINYTDNNVNLTISLSNIITTYITDLSGLFRYLRHIDFDISSWDTSNVINMAHMCADSAFRCDISSWNTSNVVNMEYMFESSLFNGDLSKWDTSKVKSMEGMFFNAMYFNGDISKWDTSNVINMAHMFEYVHDFNCDISKWDTSKVTDMSHMFRYSHSFNKNLVLWDTSNVLNMAHMFDNARNFNSNISSWNTSNVKNMFSMFALSGFNGDISKWNTSNVENMGYIFYETQFNGDISSWDTSTVKNMEYMFSNSIFNGDISLWNTSNVTNMAYMFYNSSFNNDISLWDVSNVQIIQHMFNSSQNNVTISAQLMQLLQLHNTNTDNEQKYNVTSNPKLEHVNIALDIKDRVFKFKNPITLIDYNETIATFIKRPEMSDTILIIYGPSYNNIVPFKKQMLINLRGNYASDPLKFSRPNIKILYGRKIGLPFGAILATAMYVYDKMHIFALLKRNIPFYDPTMASEGLNVEQYMSKYELVPVLID